MIEKKIANTGEMTITLAPWLEQFFQNTAALDVQKIDATILDVEANTNKSTICIGPVQVDPKTGKQYKNVITTAGKEIRVPVNPINDPDEPLYTQDDINRMGNYLLNRKGHKMRKLRDYAYFVFTINTWRRAGDNLHLTIGDVLNTDGTFKKWLKIDHEQKTSKKTVTPINSAVCSALKLYLDARNNFKLTDLLFPADSSGREMTVDGMCLVLKRAAKAIGITQKIGTHSLRKTGAYHYVMAASDKSEAEREVSQIFGHSSITITRRYLMIERQTLKKNFEDRKLEVNLVEQ